MRLPVSSFILLMPLLFSMHASLATPTMLAAKNQADGADEVNGKVEHGEEKGINQAIGAAMGVGVGLLAVGTQLWCESSLVFFLCFFVFLCVL